MEQLMYGLPGAGDSDEEGESGRCRTAADQRTPAGSTSKNNSCLQCRRRGLRCACWLCSNLSLGDQHQQVQTLLLSAGLQQRRLATYPLMCIRLIKIRQPWHKP